jgi:DNA repair exonuclease SbcCD ATPase subunit
MQPNLQEELRPKARAALKLGLIPRDSPKGVWGGNGSGETCPVCGRPVDAAEKELEIEFADDLQAVREFHLHFPCFAAWEIERKCTA